MHLLLSNRKQLLLNSEKLAVLSAYTDSKHTSKQDKTVRAIKFYLIFTALLLVKLIKTNMYYFTSMFYVKFMYKQHIGTENKTLNL